MSASNRGMAIRVGALIVVALGLLAGFLIAFGGFSFGEVKAYTVELGDAGGLQAGAPVKIAGVRAGRITDVIFLPDPTARCSEGGGPVHVRATVEVEARYTPALRSGAEVYVTTQGVLGEKYLEVAPGAGGDPWPEGLCVRGSDPARLDQLMAQAGRIMGQVDDVLSGQDGVDLGDLLVSVDRLVDRLDGILARNEDHIDGLMGDLGGGVAEGRALLSDLRQGLGGAARLDALMSDAAQATHAAARQMGPTLRQARATLGRAEVTLVDVQEVVREGAPQISALMASLAPIAEQAQQVIADGAVVTRRLVAGEGLLGRLLTDQSMYDDLRELLRNLKRHPWKILWRE